jgi:tRNA 2-selenouridine synthase SelU
MGKPVSKLAPQITDTETSGFKEEDHSWSIVNIHLACAVNTVLSICAVIFVICLLVYVVQRLVKRYCKKKRERKERQQQPGISMLPFNNQATFGTKGEYAFDRYQYQAPGSGRFTDYH